MLGEDLAARLYRALAEETLALTVPEDAEYVRRVVFAPVEAQVDLAAWLPGETLLPQEGADLGARMAAAFQQAFREGARRAAVVGTDALGVSRRTVLEAFAVLDECDVVVGPARDGGYYLLGLNEPSPELFRGMEWSTPSVLAATLARAGTLGLSSRLMESLPDIDTPEDILGEWDRLAPLLSRHGLAEALGRKLSERGR